MSIDRRGFLGALGTGFASVFLPKVEVPEVPDRFHAVINVRDRDHGRPSELGLSGAAYIAGHNWPHGKGPFRTYPRRPSFESFGEVECTDCEVGSRPIKRNYGDVTTEELLLTVQFPEQDLAKLTDLACDGGRIHSVGSDRIEVAIGWDAEEVVLDFSV